MIVSDADGARGMKKDQSTILRLRLPQGDSLHLSETRQEILAGSLRKISPAYPSALTALLAAVGIALYSTGARWQSETF